MLNHHDTRHDTSPVRGVSRGTPDRDDTVGEADWRKPVRVSTPARRSDDQEATVTDEVRVRFVGETFVAVYSMARAASYILRCDDG